MNSIKEFLKLLSYLAIDMGWSKDLTDTDIYKEEKLVDTFDSENVYKVNYVGYCKKRYGERLYCIQNWDSGMDVLGILVRDIGIQLGMLSMSHQNETRLLGDSMVLTYHLSLSSLRRFLRGDQGNALSKLVIADDDSTQSRSASKTSSYSKGVEMAYCLKMVNKLLLLIHFCELTLSLLFLAAVLAFGICLVLRLKIKVLALILRIGVSTTAFLGTMSITGMIMYFLVLKSLEPPRDPTRLSSKWDIIQVSLGSGFIIGCIRYAIQIILVPVTFVITRHYSAGENETKELKDEDLAFTNEWF